jgi:uncharacterized protein (TIGR02147 family)
MDGSGPPIHSYVDYRDYLGDWFKAGKARNKRLSFRSVARHLGLKSPNHFHLVISKKRHLSRQTLDRVQKLLRLRTKERSYLDLLFAHAVERNPEQKSSLEAQIARLATDLMSSDASSEQYSVIANPLAWYLKMGALRFEGKTAAEIAVMVRESCPFPVSDIELQTALTLLTVNNVAAVQDDRYIFKAETIKTAWDFDSQQIKQFYSDNLRLALQTIPWPIDQRFFSNVTIPCNQEVYDIAKKEIRDLCLRLLTLSNSSVVSSEECKQVVSLQFAMFPFFRFDDAKA